PLASTPSPPNNHASQMVHGRRRASNAIHTAQALIAVSAMTTLGSPTITWKANELASSAAAQRPAERDQSRVPIRATAISITTPNSSAGSRIASDVGPSSFTNSAIPHIASGGLFRLGPLLSNRCSQSPLTAMRRATSAYWEGSPYQTSLPSPSTSGRTDRTTSNDSARASDGPWPTLPLEDICPNPKCPPRPPPSSGFTSSRCWE